MKKFQLDKLSFLYEKKDKEKKKPLGYDISSAIEMADAPTIPHWEVEKELKRLHDEFMKKYNIPKVITPEQYKRRKQRCLDSICFICGRVPEDLAADMASEFHCIYCECPNCGQSSLDITTKVEDQQVKLLCKKCKWERYV